ncbi:MAG: outer membrane protein transport protein [Thermodesulfobacteriota bacterium]|nr:outer membrane protein transport protein [Thermodesulfobacteriota bacterium]
MNVQKSQWWWGYTLRTDDISYDAFEESADKKYITHTDLNYLSAAYPFHLFHRNMILSLNYQHMYNFDKEVKLYYEDEYEKYFLTNDIRYRQTGDLYTVSPAFALEITPKLSLGFTLNFWENPFSRNQWQTDNTVKRVSSRSGKEITDLEQYSDIYKFSGVNFHTGLLWDTNSTITLGAVFKSPFNADIDHTYTLAIERHNSSGAKVINSYQKSDETLEMPMSYGIGIGIRVNDALTFGVDLFRTQWSDYLLETATGDSISPITGKSEKEADIDDTTQVRLGMEYLKILEKTIIPFRLGIFYDPEPAQGNPDDFFGISTGSGFMYKKAVFDFAYQYRFGRDVHGVTMSESKSSQDIDQHIAYASMILHF